MASRNNVKDEPKAKVEDVDDDLNLDDDEGGSYDPSDGLKDDSSEYINEPSAITGLSLDDLTDVEGEDYNKRDEEERAKLDPPKGRWEKKGIWEHEDNGQMKGNYTIILDPKDKKQGDRKPDGRTIISVYGKPKPRVENGITYEPTLFIKFSPDIRNKVDFETGQVTNDRDGMYKMWLSARDLYLSIYGKNGSVKEVVEMLVNDDYIINTWKAQGGPQVNGLFDANQARARKSRVAKR